MSAPGDGPLSGARVGVDGPSFFRPQRKYGPVVAPKPKLNPYRPGGGPGDSARPDSGPTVSEASTRPEPGPTESEAYTRPEPGPTVSEASTRPEPGPTVSEASTRPEPGPKVTPVNDPGSNRACLGTVGHIPELDLPPPPPPEIDDFPPTSAFVPPPPPPPPFVESFPPPPEDASFPTPPSPLAQDLPQEGGGGSSLEMEINNLTSLIKEMESTEPQGAKVTAPEYRAPVEAPVVRAAPPAQTGPKPIGFVPVKAPVKAPKPSVPLPRGQAWSPANSSPRPQGPAVGPVSTATKFGPTAVGPVSTATKFGPTAVGPVSTATKFGPTAVGPVSTATKFGPTATGPGLVAQASPRGGPAEAQGSRGEESRCVGGSPPPPAPSSRGTAVLALSYRDVQELENLAHSLMQEMDKMPSDKVDSNDRCAQCGKPLMRSQAAVKAMGHLYHVECFLCSVCRSELQGQQFYEVDGKPLCETCHQDTLEKCSVCKKPITERMLRATGRAFHPGCFTCSVCKRPLEGQPFIVDPEGAVNCVDDYHRKFAPKCSVCHEPIIPEEGKDETVRIIALDKNFHVKCYRCEDCGVQLSTEADEGGCYPLDGHVLCLKCHTARVNLEKHD